MTDKTILTELYEDFDKLRKERRIKHTFEEFERIFYLNDTVQKDGYVSTQLGRQVCARIVETYMSWYNYLHSLVMPNPGYLMSITESSMFLDSEKEDLMHMMNQIMALVTRNTNIGQTKDKHEESLFMDESVDFWISVFNPWLIKLTAKVKDSWKEKSLSKSKMY